MKKLLSGLLLAPLAITSCGYGSNLKADAEVSNESAVGGFQYSYSFKTNKDGKLTDFASDHTIIKGLLADDIRAHKFFFKSEAGEGKKSCIAQDGTNFEYTTSVKDATADCADGETALAHNAMLEVSLFTPNTFDVPTMTANIGADLKVAKIISDSVVIKNSVNEANSFGITAAGSADYTAAIAMFGDNDIKSLENIYIYNNGDANPYAKEIMDEIKNLIMA